VNTLRTWGVGAFSAGSYGNAKGGRGEITHTETDAEGANVMSGMEWIAFVIGTALLVSIGVLAWKVTSH
jgi:hypothetical protein